MKTKTVAELLCEIAEFAKKHRWTKGARERIAGFEGNGVTPIYEYCALGFCDAVFRRNGLSTDRFGTGSAINKYLLVRAKIAKQLPPSPRGLISPRDKIIHFNDAKGRTKKEVVAVLEAACKEK